MRRFLPLSALLALISSPAAPAADPSPMDAETLAVIRVMPLVKERCLGCHGDDPEKIKAGYDMRSLQTLRRGGDSGEPAIQPGQPEASPLYLSVLRNHDDWEAMPPKDSEALSSEQIGWLKAWIQGGAPWPDEKRRAAITAQADRWLKADGITVPTTGALSPEWAARRYRPEDLWAYQPLADPSPPDGPSPHPIDRFLEAALPDGLDLAAPADARSLIRRMSYDLLGLPPTPEEVAAFETAHAQDANAAVTALTDRLLASPHYGERMARHWLDVVRYADSSGFANDYERGNTWRYRDYVVRAFNTDKPYDRFILEQIAGDELDPKDPEMRVAVGFLRMGPWELTGMEVAKVARQRFLDDVTNAVGETFLAHSLQCARCHDHKFDPVPTHDYYAIQAVFGTTQLAERDAAFLPQENTAGFEEKRYLDARRTAHQQALDAIDALQLRAAQAWFAVNGIDPSAFNTELARQQKAGKSGRKLFSGTRATLLSRGTPEDQLPPRYAGFTPEEFGRERVARKGLERLAWEYDRYRPVAFSVYDGKTPDVKSITAPARMPKKPMAAGELEETAILAGGDPFSPITAVAPAALSAVTAFNPTCAAHIPTTPAGRRLALARWIARGDNPLTARVIANRIWLWHFGQPLVGNPNNFGSTGKKPTHPELLDWLARRLIASGWSIKQLHHLILTSAAYQRSTQHPHPEILEEKDPLHSHWAAFLPRRLTAEEMRDAALQISGELNPTLGGIPVRPEINLEAALQPRMVMGTFASAWVPSPLPTQRHRRSLYVQKIRGLRDPFMEVFNEPAPDFSCERRDASTVTPQVFSLFNSQTSAQRALALAHRVLQETRSDATALDRLYQLAYSRSPTSQEKSALLSHWRAMTAIQQTLTPTRHVYPTEVVRNAVEENTGEKFSFTETLFAYRDFVPDLQPADTDARTRGLAEVALVLLNSNEFVYVD
ncbi:MAG: PSD1 domain-containing protein [Verrucomicrobiales bacterium]|nr:PSD1 domain-containing protein [Verrucomicrobiales bacterium]